ncbi:MAG: carboxypeptidase regulatory-like domain-containing protein, partial [Rhodobacteraceae bacterium]|nr:carboxypeptidase regulatory-like domain-containing protein [Paracoccaceae bacterium]
MAGATEVFDFDSYGDTFVLPVGENMGNDVTNAFQVTSAHVMALGDNTDIYVNGEATKRATLSAGESYVLKDAKQGDVITTYPSTDTEGKGVQVHLVTGDENSNFETRWYSLKPFDQWSSDYVTPVFTKAGSDGETKVWLFNPSQTDTIDITRKTNSGEDTISVAPGSAVLSDATPTGSGARFTSSAGDPFFALTQTDASGAGKAWDWGSPLVAVDQLTSQVVIGLGYGNNKQVTGGDSGQSLNAVWVTPIEAATVFVDYAGDGFDLGDGDIAIDLDALESAKIIDPSDNDMSGAIIFANASSNPLDTDPVDIAVAYGQDAGAVSAVSNGQSNSLDFGTITPPLPELESTKLISLSDDADNDGAFSPGDIVTYSILVANSGRVTVGAGGYVVDDFGVPVFGAISEGDSGGPLTYVADSTRIAFGNGSVSIADGAGLTPFPLDEGGWVSTAAIAPSELHTITFDARIKDFEDLAPGTTSFTNEGQMTSNTIGVIDRFSVTRELNFAPDIDIEKFTNGVDVTSGNGPELVVNSTVTWTYEVTNTGKTALANVVVTDDIEGAAAYQSGDSNANDLLDKGETWLFEATGLAQAGQYENTGTVTADAAYAGDAGDPIVLIPVGNGGGEVSDSDISRYVGTELGVLRGTVFVDQDADGQEDGVGIAGVTVELLDAAGSVVDTKTTNAGGHYRFDDVIPGDYAVRFASPDGYNGVSPQNTGPDATDSDGDPSTLTTELVTIAPGQTVSNIDQGFFDATPARIGNRVWNDLNFDGRQDGNEPGLAGVTVLLLDGNGDPVLDNGVPVSTVTNANGKYRFDVDPGTYIVQFDAPAGREFTEYQATGSASNDSDADPATGRSAPITVTWGDTRKDIDAGLTVHRCTDINDAFDFPGKKSA